ncbi:hypothetical protein GCM10023200_36310 [Actinomycetospora chlora]|uniref:MmpS family membrane protein n=1 Tax=Actinomycetospora chlora TaxID=663608 RepID=A0ABP9BKF5_9PSEU
MTDPSARPGAPATRPPDRDPVRWPAARSNPAVPGPARTRPVPPVPRDVDLVPRLETPPAPTPPPPRPAPVRRLLWAVGAVLVGLLAGAALAVLGRGPASPPPVELSGASTPGVLYEVTGDAARALVTFGTDSAVSQENGVGLPWQRTRPAAEDAATYTLTAQSSSDDAGRITCRISVDGTVIAEQTSSARYSVTTCVGTSPVS